MESISALTPSDHGDVELPSPSESTTAPVYSVSPEEDLLYSLNADGRRKYIHPIVKKGRYYKTRFRFAWTLIVGFFALPHIPISGHPAVFLDIAQRQFHILGGTFHPTDNLLLLGFGASVLVTVFFVTSIFGRLWCGYACPQNVYLEFVFRPLEILFEGKPATQKKLNAAPWTWEKLLRKGGKWALFVLVGLLMSMNFMAYFVSWDGLLDGLFLAPLAHRGMLLTTLGVAVMIVFDQAWFRDQMCTVACPYGRLQNVMADRDTVIPAYDIKRGEPRGRPAAGQAPTDFGDCINCRGCVAACPTGTDIRRGLQLECVATGQCMDACDAVMARHGRPAGLIRYSSQREQETGEKRFWRPRTFAYLALVVVTWTALFTMVLLRSDAQVEIVRGGREPFRALPGDVIANQQRLRITNQGHEVQRFTMEVTAPEGAELLVSVSPIVVVPAELKTVNIVTKVPKSAFTNGRAEGHYVIHSDAGFKVEQDFLLLGPYR